MNKPASYDEAFWGIDYCSSAGFDVLKKRVRDGRSTCKTVSDYLSKRQKAEEELAKAYSRSAKLSSELQESGITLRSALDSVRDETERMANSHNELSNSIALSVKRLVDFMARHKAESKQAKKQYEKLSYEAEVAEGNVIKAKPQQSAMSTRDWEKLINAQSRTKAEAERAQRTYEDAVRKAGEVRSEWEREMAVFCKMCEKQDQERYAFLQNELWVTMNATSSTAVSVDEHCENVRRKLEQIDCNSDLQLFIASSSTGAEKPAPIPFEPYRPQLQFNTSTGRENGATNVERSATFRLAHSPLEAAALSSPTGHRVDMPSNNQPTLRSREGPVQVVNQLVAKESSRSTWSPLVAVGVRARAAFEKVSLICCMKRIHAVEVETIIAERLQSVVHFEICSLKYLTFSVIPTGVHHKNLCHVR